MFGPLITREFASSEYVKLARNLLRDEQAAGAAAFVPLKKGDNFCVRYYSCVLRTQLAKERRNHFFLSSDRLNCSFGYGSVQSLVRDMQMRIFLLFLLLLRLLSL